MRLGIFMMPVHPPARSFTDTLAEDEEKALYADKLGFDEMWLGEHFSATTEPIPSPLMFMASLVPRTKNLKFGTGVICLPNHDPAIVAAEVAQFDHMSRGRFMLGIGPGGLLSDFELFGNADRGVRARKTMEAIATMQAHLGAGSALRSSRRVPHRADQGRDHSRARHRLYAEAVPESRIRRSRCRCRAATRRPRASPASTAGAILSGNNIAGQRGGDPLADLQQSLRRGRQAGGGENWRVARNVMVAASDAEARDRVFSEHGSNRYFYTYMREVLSRVGSSSDHGYNPAKRAESHV